MERVHEPRSACGSVGGATRIAAGDRPACRTARNSPRVAWLRLQEAQFAAWQLEMARIAAPPFGERARGEWLAQKFIDLGLEDVHCDDVGNVFGISPGRGKDYVA